MLGKTSWRPDRKVGFWPGGRFVAIRYDMLTNKSRRSEPGQVRSLCAQVGHPTVPMAYPVVSLGLPDAGLHIRRYRTDRM